MLLAALAAVVVVGCGEVATPLPAASGQDPAEHRFVHVHDFPTMGVRIAPPTGRPRLAWQQGLRASLPVFGPWDARMPPQVKLADYRGGDNGEGPVRPALAWIVVYPDAREVSFGGPDFAPAAARVRGRCPAYVVVDASSGQGWGAFQTCQPPYRGWPAARRRAVGWVEGGPAPLPAPEPRGGQAASCRPAWWRAGRDGRYEATA
jgi:hypothetical protein